MPRRRALALALWLMTTSLSAGPALADPSPAPAAGQATLLLVPTRGPANQARLSGAVDEVLRRELSTRLQPLTVRSAAQAGMAASGCGDGSRGLRCWGAAARAAEAGLVLVPELRRRKTDCQIELRLLHAASSTVARERTRLLPTCGGPSGTEEGGGPAVVPEILASRVAEETLTSLLHDVVPGESAELLVQRLTGMVPIPAGGFPMGSRPGEGEADEQPLRRVQMGAYWIDRTEVDVDAYRTCVDRGECDPPGTPLRAGAAQRCSWGWTGAEARPLNCIGWEQARAYCRSVGKTLPSEARWERAARGEDGRLFVWGNDWPPPAHGPNLADRSAKELLGGWPLVERYDDGFATLAPVGVSAADRSPAGVLDLGGNVAEWTLDCYAEDAYSQLPTEDPLRKGAGNCPLRVVRGGSWFQEHPTYLRAANRQPAPPNALSPQVGFRCVTPDRTGQVQPVE